MTSSQCALDGCDKPRRGTSEYCRNHRRRNDLYGSPLGGRPQFPRSMSLADRLESRSKRDPDSGCINWVGGTGIGGRYGIVTRPGGGQVLTHRAAWESAHGSSVPGGNVVRHKCDNGLCVNPDHLELGEQADNMHDMHDRGRGTYGERVHSHKLTAGDIPEIRQRIADGETLSVLARDYGVWPTTIHDIATGKTWARVK